MFIEYENIESLEVCIRNDNYSFSCKISSEFSINYLDLIFKKGHINKYQYEECNKILSVGDIGYALFNKISEDEFRLYVAKPNLFGFAIDSKGNITKAKEYIDNYYINIDTGDKKYYHIIDIDTFKYDIEIPNMFFKYPIRALSDYNYQLYYEFINKNRKKEYIDKINIDFKNSVESLKAEYTEEETLTWSKQENEAINYLNNNNCSTPVIDCILENYNIDKNLFISKIIEKSNKYNKEIGIITGKYKFLKKYIDSV